MKHPKHTQPIELTKTVLNSFLTWSLRGSKLTWNPSTPRLLRWSKWWTSWSRTTRLEQTEQRVSLSSTSVWITIHRGTWNFQNLAINVKGNTGYSPPDSWCHARMRKIWDIYISLNLRYVLKVWRHYPY